MEADGSPMAELGFLTESPPEGRPWRSSYGYTFTDNGKIFNHEGKRLISSLPRTQIDERTRVWGNRCLELWRSQLPNRSFIPNALE